MKIGSKPNKEDLHLHFEIKEEEEEDFWNEEYIPSCAQEMNFDIQQQQQQKKKKKKKQQSSFSEPTHSFFGGGDLEDERYQKKQQAVKKKLLSQPSPQKTKEQLKQLKEKKLLVSENNIHEIFTFQCLSQLTNLDFVLPSQRTEQKQQHCKGKVVWLHNQTDSGKSNMDGYIELTVANSSTEQEENNSFLISGECLEQLKMALLSQKGDIELKQITSNQNMDDEEEEEISEEDYSEEDSELNDDDYNNDNLEQQQASKNSQSKQKQEEQKLSQEAQPQTVQNRALQLKKEEKNVVDFQPTIIPISIDDEEAWKKLEYKKPDKKPYKRTPDNRLLEQKQEVILMADKQQQQQQQIQLQLQLQQTEIKQRTQDNKQEKLLGDDDDDNNDSYSFKSSDKLIWPKIIVETSNRRITTKLKEIMNGKFKLELTDLVKASNEKNSRKTLRDQNYLNEQSEAIEKYVSDIISETEINSYANKTITIAFLYIQSTFPQIAEIQDLAQQRQLQQHSSDGSSNKSSSKISIETEGSCQDKKSNKNKKQENQQISSLADEDSSFFPRYHDAKGERSKFAIQSRTFQVRKTTLEFRLFYFKLGTRIGFSRRMFADFFQQHKYLIRKQHQSLTQSSQSESQSSQFSSTNESSLKYEEMEKRAKKLEEENANWQKQKSDMLQERMYQEIFEELLEIEVMDEHSIITNNKNYENQALVDFMRLKLSKLRYIENKRKQQILTLIDLLQKKLDEQSSTQQAVVVVVENEAKQMKNENIDNNSQ